MSLCPICEEGQLTEIKEGLSSESLSFNLKLAVSHILSSVNDVDEKTVDNLLEAIELIGEEVRNNVNR